MASNSAAGTQPRPPLTPSRPQPPLTPPSQGGEEAGHPPLAKGGRGGFRRASAMPAPTALLLIAIAFGLCPGYPSAQEQEKKAQPAKAADVFDEEKDEKKPEEKDEKKESAPGGTPKAPAVSDRDTIGFTHENVAAQMTELHAPI